MQLLKFFKYFLHSSFKWVKGFFFQMDKHREIILTITKVFIMLFLLCQWEQGTPWQFSKQITKLSFQLTFQIYSVLAQTEREKKAFLEGCKRRGTTLWDYPPERSVFIRYEKVSPLVKFEIILPVLCFLLDPLTNKGCRT